MTDLPSFGEWLRKRRREMDLTRQQLADLVACAEITLRRIEADSLKPSRDLAARLLQEVGIPRAELDDWVNFSRGVSAFPANNRRQVDQTELTNLGHPLTSFVGRENEIVEITRLLKDHRLVSLIGMGGMGKTRLALELGKRALTRFPHGVWLVELDEITSPDLIPQTIASSLGLPSVPGRPVSEYLINFLRPRNTLLILDNCEHLIDACAKIAGDILSRCAEVTILTTSREPLGISGEANYAIKSLGHSDEQQSSDSMWLFVERMQLRKPRFSPLEGDTALIVQICQLLDGIPLALELAAAQSDGFSLAEMVGNLQESLELLENGNRTSPERLRSVRGSLDWSWRLLDDKERLLMQRLSVFSGDWSIASAAAICGDDSLSGVYVKSLMLQLLRKSLITVRQGATQESRYKFHSLVGHFASEKLLNSGTQAHYAWLHMEFMLAFAEAAEVELHKSEQKLWQTKIQDELPNLRSAMDYAIQEEPPYALRLASALGEFWLRSGLLQEGRYWLERSLLATEATLSQPGALNHENARILQSALYAAARLAHYMSDYASAQILEEKSLNIARRLEDPQKIALSLSLTGLTTVWRGEMDLAMQFILEAIELLRGTHFQRELAGVLNELGFLFLMQRRFEEALSPLQESLRLSRQLDDKWSLSTSLANLGSIMIQQNDIKQGQAFLQESLSIAKDIQNTLVASWVMKELAGLYVRMADDARAYELYLVVLEDCRVSGFVTGEAEALRALGEISLRKGDSQSGGSFLKRSLSLHTQLEGYSILYILMSFAHLAILKQDWSLALVLNSLVDHHLKLRHVQLTPDEKAACQWQIEQAAAHLDAPTYRQLWDKGGIIPLETIGEALLSGQTNSIIAP